MEIPTLCPSRVSTDLFLVGIDSCEQGLQGRPGELIHKQDDERWEFKYE